jgi:outer membrane receptor protein involved in Fe transport
VNRASPSTSAPGEDVVHLTPFVVSTERDNGYAAASTLAGTRLRTDLRDVGAAVSVVTAQFLADTASTNIKDLLVYTTNTEVGGMSGNFSGVDAGGAFSNPDASFASPNQSTRVRGLAGADLTRDFFPTNISMDTYNTERVDISRGANAILFGLGSPAGIINYQLKTPGLTARKFRIQGSIGSEDSYRATFDANIPIIKKQLAVRVIGLNDRRYYQQKPAYEQDKRIFASVKWEPRLVKGGLTQVQVSYENGKQNSNRPRVTPPHDGLTAWYDPQVLNKLAIDPTLGATPIVTNDAVYAHLNWPGRWYGEQAAIFTDPMSATQGGNGVPDSMTGSRAAAAGYMQWYAVADYATKAASPLFFLNKRHAPDGEAWTGLWKIQEILDPTVFDFYNQLLEGPNKKEWGDFDALNISIRQTFFRDAIGFELVYDKQNASRGNFQSISYDAATILVDMQTKLLDGTPNPNFGRPYYASNSGGNMSENEREAYRATAFAIADFRQKNNWLRHLGRHVFTGVYSKLEVSNFSRGFRGYALDLDANAFDNDPTKVTYPGFSAAHYLGPSIANLSSPAGAYIGNIKSVQEPLRNGAGLVWNTNTAAWAYPTTTVLNWRDDMDRLYNNTSKLSNRTDSHAVVWQAYLFKDLLVGTVGWRQDEYSVYDAGPAPHVPITDQFDPYNPDWVLPSSPASRFKDSTVSWSVVGHAPQFIKRWLPRGTDFSLSYNESQNFRPSAAVTDVYGVPFDPPSGTTRDCGIIISLANNKLNLRINKYKTEQKNDSVTVYNTFWPGNDVTRMLNGMRYSNTSDYLVNKWFGFEPDDPRYLPIRASWTSNPGAVNPTLTTAEATYRANWFKERTREEWLWRVDPKLVESWNFVQAANGGNWSCTRPFGVGNVADTISEGWEFEATYNPVKNWRIALNVAQQKASKANVAADFAAFIDANYPIWTDGDGNLATNTRAQNGFEDIPYYNGSYGTTFGGQTLKNMYVPYMNALAAEGMPVQELRQWRANLVTTYDFKNGIIKGFSVGGSVRWQDKVAIGYPAIKNSVGTWVYDARNPYHGPTLTNYDVWFRYGRKILRNKISWSVQLNIRDIFGSKKLIPLSAQPNGEIASARIPQPNTWTLTNTFDF